ncbi:GTP 3',8-cyclase MoaA [Rhodococcus koreensis]|uniref:GTP 3',8-cyclase MoaA n=1 Tax=Rhodococcus koreensis TaxID=99653 RepID=UPI00366D2E30
MTGGLPVAVRDRLGRPLRDLRISVTDRCNFRCRYCMPRETFGSEHAFLERDALLDFGELKEIASTAYELGVRKIRLTGGEPLMRRDICELVASLSSLPGLDLAMTSNGVLLPRYAESLAASGLRRVTVSLDSLEQATFEAMSDSRYQVQDVLDGIAAAERAGLGAVKINMVVKRGVNDSEIADMAARFRDTPHIVRFIEYMDVGSTNGWDASQVVPASEIVDAVRSRFPADAVDDLDRRAVATRFRYRDGSGEFGVISSVSKPFCSTCTRVRVSAEGTLYTCLFASAGLDLRAILRGHRTPGDLAAALAGRWASRDDRYSESRGSLQADRNNKIEMSYIGG